MPSDLHTELERRETLEQLVGTVLHQHFEFSPGRTRRYVIQNTIVEALGIKRSNALAVAVWDYIKARGVQVKAIRGLYYFDGIISKDAP
jgi:hypothetical protein